MFDRGLIASKDVFTTPINDDEYKNWCGLFSNFPTLEKREQFFTTVRNYSHLEMATLKRLAEAYAQDLGPEALQGEMSKLGNKKDNSPVTIVDTSMNRGFFGGGMR